ncbi:transglutaminase-like domain-containing protein [Cellulomonas marina]|uniref:Transglutaminase-like superfamily protein n=1 Tax=Cellulomonas marina TaxID=988821 RepID=A0A1I0YT20_9CELL|nr:transglutaminase-like domain-containing protein [Cellulomonas marina]GIG27526.1 hypothetical protein Cma02nite_01260 [Cellulomonas marina]SFB16351.1 Transglutaminase-like superfamily protein [Cellulomonas marina]
MSAAPPVREPVVVAAPSTAPSTAFSTAPSTGSGGPARRAAVVDLVAGLAALGVALAPLVALHGGTVAVPALVGGLAAGAGVAALAAARRWSAPATLLAVLVVHLLAGGALAAPGTTVAGVVPTAATLRALGPGVVDAPHALLTLTPPIGGDGEVLLTAWVLALLGAAAVASGALRSSARGLARAAVVLVPPLVAAAVALLGTATPAPAPAVTGAALAGLLVAGAVLRRLPRAGAAATARTALVGALAVGLAVGGGVAAGAGGAAGGARFVLREHVVPPFELRDRPSPLSSFRALVARDDEVLLRATGLVPGARVRLATLDRYDGTVWGVAGGSGTGGSGVLRRVASGTPLPPRATGLAPTRGAGTREVTVRLEAAGLRGVWLPTVGRTTQVTAGAGVEATDLRWDDATGTAVDAGGLAAGDAWTVRALVDPVPADALVGDAPPADVPLPDVTGVPEAVGARAQEVARGAGAPVQVARALSAWLTDEGWFSHGLVATGDHPSAPGHGAARLTELVGGDLMVGDDEQYAAVLALMARRVGLPSRVVVGFAPTDEQLAAGTVALRGSDVHAWVEVALAGWGWVPFDPTPPRERTPQEDRTSAPDDAQPQVRQPPPAEPEAQAPPEEDTEQPRTGRRDVPAPEGRSWRAVAAVVGVVGGPALLLLGPPLAVVALKAWRRRRRRRGPDTVRRVADGWQELLDRARDLGHLPTPSATREEAAEALVAAVLARRGRRAGRADAPSAAARLHASARGLARSADAHVFAPGRPTPAEADAVWAETDGALAALDAVLPPLRRLRARAAVASLRRTRPVRPRSLVRRPAVLPGALR